MTATTMSSIPLSDIRTAVDAGATLPASFYTDPAIFARERERIFKPAWQFVALTHELRRPGDFITTRLMDTPVIVVRTTEGDLRAYANVCPHRAAEMVLQPCGSRKTIQCHYHAWTWSLEGHLRAAPCSNQQARFDPAEFPLRTLHLATLGPFVFVSLAKDPLPFEQLVDTLPRIIRQSGHDLDGLIRYERRQYDIAANWKVVVENFLECYHCPASHPSFSDLIDLANYTVTPYRFFSVQKGPLRQRDAEGGYRPVEGVREGIYNFLWPLFMVNAYPGPGNASSNIIVPLGPQRTLVNYDFFGVDGGDESERSALTALIDEVQREDVVICESVQRGLGSGFYDRGKLMLTHENGIQHFQQLVLDALGS